MNKKTVSSIGIILGIVIIIIGFCVQGISIERYTTTIGSDIKFGADFYTEMYDVTRDVGHAVNNAKNTIADAVEGVCDAIGWLIVVLGLFDIAYFSVKLAPCEDTGEINTYNVAPTTGVPTNTIQHQEPQQSAVNTPVSISPVAGGWTCTCGRNHAPYELSCVCGLTKAEAKMNNKQNS